MCLRNTIYRPSKQTWLVSVTVVMPLAKYRGTMYLLKALIVWLNSHMYVMHPTIPIFLDAGVCRAQPSQNATFNPTESLVRGTCLRPCRLCLSNGIYECRIRQNRDFLEVLNMLHNTNRQNPMALLVYCKIHYWLLKFLFLLRCLHTVIENLCGGYPSNRGQVWPITCPRVWGPLTEHAPAPCAKPTPHN